LLVRVRRFHSVLFLTQYYYFIRLYDWQADLEYGMTDNGLNFITMLWGSKNEADFAGVAFTGKFKYAAGMNEYVIGITFSVFDPPSLITPLILGPTFLRSQTCRLPTVPRFGTSTSARSRARVSPSSRPQRRPAQRGCRTSRTRARATYVFLSDHVATVTYIK
jgi:hypothetical protein